jgi:acetyltransferase-like isoleucine patch superfamily enzyme
MKYDKHELANVLNKFIEEQKLNFLQDDNKNKLGIGDCVRINMVVRIVSHDARDSDIVSADHYIHQGLHLIDYDLLYGFRLRSIGVYKNKFVDTSCLSSRFSPLAYGGTNQFLSMRPIFSTKYKIEKDGTGYDVFDIMSNNVAIDYFDVHISKRSIFTEHDKLCYNNEGREIADELLSEGV